MAINTLTQLPDAVNAFYVRTFLKRARPWLIYDLAAQTTVLPQKNSKTVKFRRYNAYEPAMVPLTAGRTPPGQTASVTDITATVQWHGDFTETADEVHMTNRDPVVTQLQEVHGEQAGETYDMIIRDALMGGSSIFYANKVSARANVVDAPSDADLKLLREVLHREKGRYITDIQKAGSGQGTSPVPPSFHLYIHTDLIGDMENLTGFIPAHKYPSPPSTPYEIGYAHGFRIFASQNAPILDGVGAADASDTVKETSDNADVYQCIAVAADAYGVIPLGKKNAETYVEGLGSAGAADPLHQRATVGWKHPMTAKRLNENWIIRYECACTARGSLA
jgi:N4-gp56 family major capsid protein